MNKLVSGLFKIVCATCPAHAVVRESVRYQDGLLIHYECHGKTYLAAMYPYFSRTITQRDGSRCQYSFNVLKPDVSCLTEPLDHVYVLDTELDALSQERVVEMQQHLAGSFLEAETKPRPHSCSEEEWAEILADGRKTLDLLTRFSGGKQ